MAVEDEVLAGEQVERVDPERRPGRDIGVDRVEGIVEVAADRVVEQPQPLDADQLLRAEGVVIVAGEDQTVLAEAAVDAVGRVERGAEIEAVVAVAGAAGDRLGAARDQDEQCPARRCR